MKLTWFGGKTLRIHIGGAIVIVDPDGAPTNVRQAELRGGANHVVTLAAQDRPLVDPDNWRQAVARPLDPPPSLEIASIGQSTLLVSAPGEPPLLIADVVELPHLGRWIDTAVIVLFGERGARLAEAIEVLDLARPRLLALAADEAALDWLMDRLVRRQNYPDVVSVAALESGLALEV